MKITRLLMIAGLAGLAALTCNVSAGDDEVNLYSARKENLIKPLLDRFSEATGIEVNLVTADADAIIKRLQSEGRNSPADVMITVDAGRLHRAIEAGVVQKIQSDTLDSLVPENYRHPEGYWYGLSVRARPILYSKERVKPGALSTYEALSDSEWKGRFCIRSSSNIYNQSLVASMIDANGLEKTEATVTKWVKNLAIPPRGGDRDQIKSIATGQCDVTLANTYYFGQMLNDEQKSERSAAQKVAIFWPNQDGRGTHVNISGAAVTAASKNRENAIQLIEFLVSDASQKWYAETNFEYPVRSDIPASELLKSWGKFKADDINLSRLGELNREALMLMDRAGWR